MIRFVLEQLLDLLKLRATISFDSHHLIMADFDAESSVPETSVNSVTDAWDLQPVSSDVHKEAYAKAMREGMAKVCGEHGGPENYLRVRFQSQNHLKEWMQYLINLVPLDAAQFNFSADLPGTKIDTVEKAAILKCIRPYGFC